MSAHDTISALNEWLGTQVIGQSQLIERILICLIADGHLLVEGAPGLAKTRAIKSLADGIEGNFHRVQFTPDLLPADITGTDIYRPETGEFQFQAGPIFHNLVLADEINRAPAKVQSALLEAMAERQISVGKKSYSLPQLFLVMATQNPIEQEGTYPLPEAQLDRFLMHVMVDYPSIEAEREILKLSRAEAKLEAPQLHTPVSEADILSARQQALNLHMSEAVEDYIVRLVDATRRGLVEAIEFGVSPRATIALDRCSRALAWLRGKDFVSPDEVISVLPDVFRHRLLLSFDAQARGVSSDAVIDQLLENVSVA